MQNPCPTAIKCACADGNPLAGNSSEAPDELVFNGQSFQTLPPPLGTSWTAVGCIGLVTSTISQEDADLKAAAQASQCATSTWLNPVNGNPNPVLNPPGIPTGPTGGGPYAGVTNTPQTGSAFCEDGTEFQWTAAAGLFFGLTQEIADAKALSYADQQAAILMTCLSDIQDTVCAGGAYNQTITASGMDLAGPGQTNNWEMISGMLPPGLTFNGGMLASSTATVTGTATVPGDYSFTIQVTNPDGGFVQKFYTLSVQGITNLGGLPSGNLGTPYNYQLVAVGYDDPVFSLVNSPLPTRLPAGLSMDDTGLITGTPTMQETVATVFGVTEADGGPTCSAVGTISVGGICGAIPTVSRTLNMPEPNYFSIAAATGGSPYLLFAEVDQQQNVVCWNLSDNTTQTIQSLNPNNDNARFSAYASSTGKFWTGSSNSNSDGIHLYEFTPSPLASTGRSIAGSDPQGFAGDGLVYNTGTGNLYAMTPRTLHVMSPITATVIGTYTTSIFTSLQGGPDFDAVGGRVFAGQIDGTNSNALLVFSSASIPVLLHQWPLTAAGTSFSIYSLIYAPAVNTVYCLLQNTDDSTWKVLAVNPDTGAIIATIPVNQSTNPQFPLVMVYNPSSNLVFVPNYDAKIAVICTVSNVLLGYLNITTLGGAYVPLNHGNAFVNLTPTPVPGEILIS